MHVDSPPAHPGALLWEGPGVRVTREHLEAGRRRWALASIEAVEAEARPPRLGPSALVALLCAGLGLPLALSMTTRAQSALPLGEVGLAVCALLLFASILHLVFAEERYCLVIRTARGEQQALRSRDHQLVIRLVSVVREAAAAQRAHAAPRG